MSLISGCVATVMAFEGNLFGALTWIIIAALFDFCDGFAARLLKAYSPMGKELDSLSDMVSFGVAPGIVLFCSRPVSLPCLSGNWVAIYPSWRLSSLPSPAYGWRSST